MCSSSTGVSSVTRWVPDWAGPPATVADGDAAGAFAPAVAVIISKARVDRPRHRCAVTAPADETTSCISSLLEGLDVERLGDAEVERRAWAPGRCADADAGAVADLVLAVQHIDHRHAQVDRAERIAEPHRTARRQVELHIGLELAGVGEALAQAVLVAALDAEGGAPQHIGSAAGNGQGLVVVEIDVMLADVGELFRVGEGNGLRRHVIGRL